jgi:hypothetical protein
MKGIQIPKINPKILDSESDLFGEKYKFRNDVDYKLARSPPKSMRTKRSKADKHFFRYQDGYRNREFEEMERSANSSDSSSVDEAKEIVDAKFLPDKGKYIGFIDGRLAFTSKVLRKFTDKRGRTFILTSSGSVYRVKST